VGAASGGRKGEDVRGANVTEIILNDGDRLDWALKAFRRRVQKSGVLQELRKKRFYVKPSLAKRLKAAAAKRRGRRERRKR
jgi:small subunit ribosomal protein S21